MVKTHILKIMAGCTEKREQEKLAGHRPGPGAATHVTHSGVIFGHWASCVTAFHCGLLWRAHVLGAPAMCVPAVHGDAGCLASPLLRCGTSITS